MGIYSSQGWSKHIYFLRISPPPSPALLQQRCHFHSFFFFFFCRQGLDRGHGGKCSQWTTGGARESGRHRRLQPRGPDSQTRDAGRPESRRRVPRQVRQAGWGRQRNIDHGWPHTTLFALSEHTVARLSKNRVLGFASVVSPKITACKTWICSDGFIYVILTTNPSQSHLNVPRWTLYRWHMPYGIVAITGAYSRWGCYWWNGNMFTAALVSISQTTNRLHIITRNNSLNFCLAIFFI